MANPGLRQGYMFQKRFWHFYGIIGSLYAAWWAGSYIQAEADKGMMTYKHKSQLFKDVKIPPGEDFWNR